MNNQNTNNKNTMHQKNQNRNPTKADNNNNSTYQLLQVNKQLNKLNIFDKKPTLTKIYTGLSIPQHITEEDSSVDKISKTQGSNKQLAARQGGLEVVDNNEKPTISRQSTLTKEEGLAKKNTITDKIDATNLSEKDV